MSLLELLIAAKNRSTCILLLCGLHYKVKTQSHSFCRHPVYSNIFLDGQVVMQTLNIGWRLQNPKSYFMSMGHLREIKIKVKVCSKCRRAVYPDFYENGIIFLHNKLMISIETILDLNQLLQTGGSFVEAIKKKIALLGQLEGIPKTTLTTDLNSIALKLDKIVIAVMSIIVKGSDLDSVLCFICGNCPKIVCTDGNTKVGAIFSNLLKQFVRHFLLICNC